MAFLPGYEYDIFVSYSHGSADASGDSALRKWTRALVDRLERWIRAGRPQFDNLSIWFDNQVDPTVGLTSSLKEDVERSAILMIVMSPPYLSSRWAMSELEWFEQQIATRRDRPGSVFVLRALPTDERKWPAALLDSRGYPTPGFWFYPRDQRTPTPFGFPEPSEQDDDFNRAVASVAITLVHHLNRLAHLSQTEPLAMEAPASPDASIPHEGRTLQVVPPLPLPPIEPNRRIFLCHASEDKLVVKELYDRLRRSGFSPWLDKVDLLGGQNWDREIRKAIARARVVLVCLSPRSEKRGYVQKEIVHALDIADEQPEDAIYLVPVRLEPCPLPSRVSRYQAIDLFEDDGYARLEATLKHAL